MACFAFDVALGLQCVETCPKRPLADLRCKHDSFNFGETLAVALVTAFRQGQAYGHFGLGDGVVSHQALNKHVECV